MIIVLVEHAPSIQRTEQVPIELDISAIEKYVRIIISSNNGKGAPRMKHQCAFRTQTRHIKGDLLIRMSIIRVISVVIIQFIYVCQ